MNTLVQLLIAFSKRGMGEMKNMEPAKMVKLRLIFLAPSRGLIGYSTEFMTMTRGYGIMSHTFEKYAPVIKNWNPVVKRVLLYIHECW